MNAEKGRIRRNHTFIAVLIGSIFIRVRPRLNSAHAFPPQRKPATRRPGANEANRVLWCEGRRTPLPSYAPGHTR